MISDKLKAAILRELKLSDFPLADTTTAPEVPGWDSLAHVRILACIEADFGIQFRGLEVLRLRTVGDLQKLVDKKCAAKSA